MVLLILESHGPLHFGACVNKTAQRITGERMIVAARVHVLELPGFGVMLLGVHSREEKAFNFVCGVERVAFPLEYLVGVGFQNTAHVGGEGAAILVNDLTEYHHLAVAEKIRRGPVE